MNHEIPTWVLLLAGYGVGTLSRQLTDLFATLIVESKWRAAEYKRRRNRK